MTGHPVAPSVAAIVHAVAAAYGVTWRDIHSHRRDPRAVRARQVGMWLAREMTLRSYPSIGRVFRRHHTTIMYNASRVAERMAADPGFAGEVRRLGASLDIA